MGSPDPEIRRKSEEAFLDELKRCEQLGLKMLNFHPGSHRTQLSEEECLDLIALSVNRCLKKTKDVVAVIENTAGQGGSVGKNFEQIKYLIEKVDDKKEWEYALIPAIFLHQVMILEEENLTTNHLEFDKLQG